MAPSNNVPDTMVAAAPPVTCRSVTDHLGSVRLVVNVADGSVAQKIDYTAWGVPTYDLTPGLAGPEFQPFGFAGGLYDADTGLVHFGARDYDPELGAWISKDAARFAGGWNFYEYANSDPVNFRDPTGRTPEGAWVGGGIGSIFGPIGAGVGAWLGDKISDDLERGGTGPMPDGGGMCREPKPPEPEQESAARCNCLCANGTHYNAKDWATCQRYCSPYSGQCL